MPTIAQAVDEFVAQHPETSQLLQTLTFYIDEWGSSPAASDPCWSSGRWSGPDVLGAAGPEEGVSLRCSSQVEAEQLPRLVPDFVDWFLARKVDIRSADGSIQQRFRWTALMR